MFAPQAMPPPTARDVAARVAVRAGNTPAAGRSGGRHFGDGREPDRVDAGAAGIRGRAGQSRAVLGARERGAALRERAGRQGAGDPRRRAWSPTTTRSCRRSRGSRCSICCSARVTARRSISWRCSTSCSSSARRRRGRPRRTRSPDRVSRRAATSASPASSPPRRRRSSKVCASAMAKSLAGTRLDAMSVTGFDDDGARLLAQALGDARRQKFQLQLQRMEKLQPLARRRHQAGRRRRRRRLAAFARAPAVGERPGPRSRTGRSSSRWRSRCRRRRGSRR